jgi:hypothetical protein
MLEKVPRLRRLPVFGFFLREYNRYSPDFSLRIILSATSSTFRMSAYTLRVASEVPSSVIIPRLFCRDRRWAKVLFPIQTQFWGDRIGWVMYPSGHVWTIATRIEETTEKSGRHRLSRIIDV